VTLLDRTGPTPVVAEAVQRPVQAASPLALYYLLIGSATALLCIGLVMVLSASSVMSYARTGSLFTIAGRQLSWTLVGLVLLVVGAALPVRTLRRLTYPCWRCPG